MNMSEEIQTLEGPKKTMEQWAEERGHVDPIPAPGQRLAITDFKRFIYDCARVRAGFAIGKEMTGEEYDRAVHRAMHETLAR
jgi:hypothetical protein